MFVWTPDMIRFMQAANERNDYHARLAAILAPKLSNCRTLCDAGCGLGALSAALSPYFASITAADVSGEALDVLRRTPCTAAWEHHAAAMRFADIGG